MITSTYPATFSEVGHLRAKHEQCPWYLIERDEEIGITAELLMDDDVISTYEPAYGH